jgi:hypothetical protein
MHCRALGVSSVPENSALALRSSIAPTLPGWCDTGPHAGDQNLNDICENLFEFGIAGKSAPGEALARCWQARARAARSVMAIS